MLSGRIGEFHCQGKKNANNFTCCWPSYAIAIRSIGAAHVKVGHVTVEGSENHETSSAKVCHPNLFQDGKLPRRRWNQRPSSVAVSPWLRVFSGKTK